MITSEILLLLNAIPDASYWEDCIVNYFTLKEVDISLLPVDFFHWFSDVDKTKYYSCLVPDIDCFWWALFKIYCQSLEMEFDIFHKEMIKHIVEAFDTYGTKYMKNISIDRVNWIIKLKESDIPDTETIIKEISKALVSNLEKFSNIDINTIKAFQEKCLKDSQLQEELLVEQSRISHSLLEQQKF